MIFSVQLSCDTTPFDNFDFPQLNISDGQNFIIVPLNSFVHCFMYAYYFLTNYSPAYKKKIWWKKHITQLQIVGSSNNRIILVKVEDPLTLFLYFQAQFLLIIIQGVKTFTVPGCSYPKFPVVLMLPQLVLILWLFCDFYYNAYIKPKSNVKTS